MATVNAAAAAKKKAAKKQVPEFTFMWKGVDKARKPVKGEMRAPTETFVQTELRRKGITVETIKKKRGMNKSITGKDVAVFTRQLSTMMRAGVPLLQSFDIVAKGHANPAVSRLLYSVKSEIESGSTLADAFGKHPKYFNDLYCNLIGAGEAAGILEEVLERLATYQEKTMALQSKIKSALFYPTAVIAAAIIITAVIMIFVIPAFKSVFASFGAELPLPTIIVMTISEYTVAYWYIVVGACVGAFFGFKMAYARSEKMRNNIDRAILHFPIFGELIRKSIIARWTRTLATMFAAGMPLVDSLTSVAGAAGNYVYRSATFRIQNEVSGGASLTNSMINTDVFPNMVTQMALIGEESGSLDTMLGKAADYFEREVDDAVDGLKSLMEPLIMVILGTLIGGIVVAMYLPIFKLGAAV